MPMCAYRHIHVHIHTSHQIKTLLVRCGATHLWKTQVELNDFEASLVYITNSRMAKATMRDPVIKLKKKKSLNVVQGRYMTQMGPASDHRPGSQYIK